MRAPPRLDASCAQMMRRSTTRTHHARANRGRAARCRYPWRARRRRQGCHPVETLMPVTAANPHRRLASSRRQRVEMPVPHSVVGFESYRRQARCLRRRRACRRPTVTAVRSAVIRRQYSPTGAPHARRSRRRGEHPPPSTWRTIFDKMANARCVYLHYDAAEPAFTMKCVHASSLSLITPANTLISLAQVRPHRRPTRHRRRGIKQLCHRIRQHGPFAPRRRPRDGRRRDG